MSAETVWLFVLQKKVYNRFTLVHCKTVTAAGALRSNGKDNPKS